MRGKWAAGISPRHFTWVIKDRFAVSERPGGFGEGHRKVRREEEILWIRAPGVRPDHLRAAGPVEPVELHGARLAYGHHPIPRRRRPASRVARVLLRPRQGAQRRAERAPARRRAGRPRHGRARRATCSGRAGSPARPPRSARSSTSWSAPWDPTVERSSPSRTRRSRHRRPTRAVTDRHPDPWAPLRGGLRRPGGGARACPAAEPRPRCRVRARHGRGERRPREHDQLRGARRDRRRRRRSFAAPQLLESALRAGRPRACWTTTACRGDRHGREAPPSRRAATSGPWGCAAASRAECAPSSRSAATSATALRTCARRRGRGRWRRLPASPRSMRPSPSAVSSRAGS